MKFRKTSLAAMFMAMVASASFGANAVRDQDKKESRVPGAIPPGNPPRRQGGRHARRRREALNRRNASRT